MRASENPDRRDIDRTIGSLTSISKGRMMYWRNILGVKRASFSSLGLYTLASPAFLLLFAAEGETLVRTPKALCDPYGRKHLDVTRRASGILQESSRRKTVSCLTHLFMMADLPLAEH